MLTWKYRPSAALVGAPFDASAERPSGRSRTPRSQISSSLTRIGRAGIKELDIQVGGRPVGWSPYLKENKDVRRRIFRRSRLGRTGLWRTGLWRTGLWRTGLWRTWIRWARFRWSRLGRRWRGWRTRRTRIRWTPQARGGRYGCPAARRTGERRAARAA